MHALIYQVSPEQICKHGRKVLIAM